jgi:hypothetical protein
VFQAQPQGRGHSRRGHRLDDDRRAAGRVDTGVGFYAVARFEPVLEIEPSTDTAHRSVAHRPFPRADAVGRHRLRLTLRSAVGTPVVRTIAANRVHRPHRSELRPALPFLIPRTNSTAGWSPRRGVR